MSDLIGSVFERNPLAGSSPSSGSQQKPPSKQKNDLGVSQTGFPAVQHRSQSAFARRKKPGEAGAASSRPSAPPTVVAARSSNGSSVPAATKSVRVESPDNSWRAPPPPKSNDFDAEMRRQIDEENTRRVEAMTEEEREEARREIIERFGEGIGDLLKKVREARERRAAIDAQAATPKAEETPAETPSKSGESESGSSPRLQPATVEPTEPATNPSEATHDVPRPTPIIHSATRPSSRTERRLRFAEVQPNDIHVYESAPPSPRRKILALPPPPDDHSDPSIVSLGRAPPSVIPRTARQDDQADVDDTQEEGTLEHIRRRYFPNAPADDPSVEWLKPLPSSSSVDDKVLRFDLSGNVIPPSESSTLPTHLGLHHHAEGVHAGYTLEDIFLLSRSTVPAQRATMFAVLAHIAQKLGAGEGSINVGGREKEDQLRKRMIAAAVEAMAERGSLGPRAIDLLWGCTVNWTASPLPDDTFDDSTSTGIPVDHILSQTSDALAHGTLPPSMSLKLLDILNFLLAQGPKDTCTKLVSTPKLLRHIIQTYLMGPVSGSEGDIPHQPEALELLILFTQSTRYTAEKMAESAADAVLRFVTSPLTEEAISHIQRSQTLSPSTQRSIKLLISTLRLYKAFAVYGLYSHVATTATSHFVLMPRLVAVLPNPSSTNLKEAWMQLVEIWTVCATDPHQTRPTHDILWTQVTAWDWGVEALELANDTLRDKAAAQQQDHNGPWRVCAASWHAAAAWLEGARVNGVKGGEKERERAVSLVRPVLADEGNHLKSCIAYLQDALGPEENRSSLQSSADFLSAIIRLWLACLPTPDQTPPSPPFELPFSDISRVCAHLVKAPMSLSLSVLTKRTLTTMLFLYTRLSRCLPGATLDLWIAQSISVLIRLVPGDEAYATTLIGGVCSVLSLDLLQAKGFVHPKMEGSRSTMEVIVPFLTQPLRSSKDALAPLHPTPPALQRAITQNPSYHTNSPYGLPFHSDWPFKPLDHLLRSGTSPVFQSLPSSWDFSEVDVVRMSLVLARVARDVLSTYGLTSAAMTRDQIIFGCMKVFMLEQDQDGTKQKGVIEEVFRDDIVTALMDVLLSPCRYQPPSSSAKLPESSGTLEQAALPFLGTSTPFYQFYTDFVGLYDSISFSHPIFTQLLIPPTSMRYPVDYRKYLWGEYSHLVANIRLSADNILSDDLSQWFYPIERDPEMIGAYIKSLKGNQVQGFMRLIAVHHVAAHAWGGDFVAKEYRSSSSNPQGVLKALLTPGNDVVLRDVLHYSQTYPKGVLRLDPECYGALDREAMSKRVEQVRAVGGETLVGRLGLIQAESP